MTLESNLTSLAQAIGADMKARIVVGAVKTSDIQGSLGLNAGSGTTNVTTRALTGINGWEDSTDQVSIPANRTDGEGTGPNLVSEGQRLILPRTLDIESLPISRTAKIVARAAQEFGLIVWDRGETSTTIRAVNATGMSADPYPALLAGHEVNPLAGFPVAQLQVVAKDWMPA